jgi:hypothetical protein
MNWLLVIFTAGFSAAGAFTIDRAVQTLGPWPDRGQCEEAIAKQQPLHPEGTLACVWRPPPEEPPNKDRVDLRMN